MENEEMTENQRRAAEEIDRLRIPGSIIEQAVQASISEYSRTTWQETMEGIEEGRGFRNNTNALNEANQLTDAVNAVSEVLRANGVDILQMDANTIGQIALAGFDRAHEAGNTTAQQRNGGGRGGRR